MATGGYVIKDASVVIDGTDDISALIRQVVVHREYADVDATGMRSDGASEHKHGLRSDSFTFTAKSTFGAEGLDAVFEALFENESEFTVTVTPHEGVVSESNPGFEGTAILLTYEPISGEVGALATTELNIPCQGRIAKRTT